jgi:hypothetical protein
MSNEIDPRNLPPGTRVWVYLRNSEGDNQTIESQESAVRALCAEKGWQISRTFVDRWKSGGSVDGREAFELLVHLARRKPREADLLVIWAYARFGRNQNHSPFYRAELRLNGWQILSMTDNIPLGDLAPVFEALIDWKNTQFLIDLKVGTIRGLRYIAECGCVPTGQICLGYTAKEKPIGVKKSGAPRMGRKPEIHPTKGPLVIRAFELKSAGAPNEVISQETGLYKATNGAWHNLFTNRAYVGEFEFHGEVFTNVYPPLIGNELFDAVQKLIPPKKTRKLTGRDHPRRKGSRYILANITYCNHCGSPIEGKSAYGYRYYVCSQHNKQAVNCPDASLIPADELEGEILRILLEHILKEDYLQDLLSWTNNLLNEGLKEVELRLEATRKELSEADLLCRRMAKNFGVLEVPSRTAEQLLREQEAEADRLRIEVGRLQHKLDNSRVEVSREKIEEYVHRTRDLIDKGEFFDLREFVEQICSRIILSGEECCVELHFPVAVSGPQVTSNSPAHQSVGDRSMVESV